MENKNEMIINAYFKKALSLLVNVISMVTKTKLNAMKNTLLFLNHFNFDNR